MKQEPTVGTLGRFRLIKDFGLNILASVVYMASTQLLVFPAISRSITLAEFGNVMFTVAAVNVVGTAVGMALNNTRLVRQKSYAEDPDSGTDYGDFNLLATIISALSCAAVMAVFLIFFKEIVRPRAIPAIGLLTLLVIFRNYYSVEYRLRINYVRNFLMSSFAALGFVVGLVVFHVSNNWLHALLLGEFAAAAYLVFTSRVLREPLRRTHLFRGTAQTLGTLIFSGGIGALVVYLDRFLLYPLLGSSAVAQFTVASFLGKSASLVVGPIAAVLLTYYAKENAPKWSSYVRHVTLVFLATVFGGAGIVVLGPMILRVLYPTVFPSAHEYFLAATLASLVFVLSVALQPALVAYSSRRNLITVQLVHLITYLLFAWAGSLWGGLHGFCWGTLGANLLRCVLILATLRSSLPKAAG